MGWMWRRTFWLGGPFRATLSNRGWGWSIGLPFRRYGVGPSGSTYVYWLELDLTASAWVERSGFSVPR
jgi:hypothetical protein